MDFEAIKKAAEGYKPAMVKFLRDMIAIPSESCEEKGVVHRIAEEMKALVEKANAGKLMPEDYAGGTFGVTNLGKLNSFDSVPLPQPPQPPSWPPARPKRWPLWWREKMARM